VHKEKERSIHREIDCRFECEDLQGDRGGLIKKLTQTSSTFVEDFISDLRTTIPSDAAPTQTTIRYCTKADIMVSSGTIWFKDLQRGVIQLLGRSLVEHFAWYLVGPICTVRELYISLLNNNKISYLLHRFSHLGFFRDYCSKISVYL
jgi:hypothetical protein